MMTSCKRTLLITAIAIATLSGGYYAFCRGASGVPKEMTQHRTPDEVWAGVLKRRQELHQQSFPEEEESTKMCWWMSYLTDKIVTAWMEQLDNRWHPPLSPHEPTWPRCWGVINEFIDLNPPPQREGMDEKRRPYVFVDGTKGELVDYPTPVPWSGGWGLHWRNDAARQRFDIDAKWFRSPQIHDKNWPTGEEASSYQIRGSKVAAVVRYVIKHGSFSGPVIGDDSFFIVGSRVEKPDGEKYSEFRHPWLDFKKYNFRVRMNYDSASSQPEPATDEERALIEKVARFVEAQIIAYSLFGLENFTVLQTQGGDKDLYLPAGRTSAGNYQVPVGYVAQRVTGQRPVYGTTTKQMRVNVKGQQANIGGEVIKAATQWVEIPEAERLVASLTTLRASLGIGAVQDLRFEK